ncbi:iron-containing redox enzyme family protein [Nocardiopsis tropica]|uniref:Iron-containing redox enzyme family protein n=1 Tax=Nocardiopsis tropica TaxID=109330 RepID=A0ABV2A0Q0_9ACTN
MILPEPRGPLSERLLLSLTRPPLEGEATLPRGVPAVADPLQDEDLQLSLFTCYQLHYSDLEGVDGTWEWNPALLALRAELEGELERALREATLGHGWQGQEDTLPCEVPTRLTGMIRAAGGPPLSAFMRRHATFGQYREFVKHRSLYHLREADPHTWAIPRVQGRAKAALIEIQADEYGQGQAARMHSELFRNTMRGLGLDTAYGAYLESVPAVTLALNNTMSLLGLHRRLRGALLGHLAAFEMTSTGPNRDLSLGLRRLGVAVQVRRYFDEHVEADAAHEQIAARDMCGSFAADHPDLVPDVLFGAAACLTLDRLWAEHVLGRWQAGESSLSSADAREAAAT